jgi:pyruvate dehydrogenase E1 component alpha subunit
MELFEEKLIRGSVHPYIGMEAIAVGVCAALGKNDYITSTHRGHGHCVAKGLDLKLMMAEIIGREDGYCRGRGGSMHITAIDEGMLGADAIVAGSSAIAVGAAHGLRLKGHDGVIVCFFGDGASNQGILHEACNLGAVPTPPWSSSARNNQWAISTPAAASTRIDNIADRAAGYGFRVIVDGNDDARGARRHRHGGRPSSGRRRPDPAPRPRATASPLTRCHEDRPPPSPRSSMRGARTRSSASRATNTEAGVATERLEQIEEEARANVEAAVEFALTSPRPEPESALEDVYAPAEWVTAGRLS